MKLKLSKVMFVTALLFTNLTFAAGKQIKILVNGMVCPFCSQGITKNFKEQPAVQDVKVDMEKKEVTVSLKEGTEISDAEITKLIKDAGVSVDKIVR